MLKVGKMEYDEKIAHSCLVKFQFIYNELKSAEKRAADFCLTNPEMVSSSTISEVSAMAKCSEATLVRLAKRLGYAGYPELREALFAEKPDDIAEHIGIRAGDDVAAIAKSVFGASVMALNDSLNSLDIQNIEQAICAMQRAKRILFCAAGDASVVALSGVYKLTRMGVLVEYHEDFDAQLVCLSHMHPGDVLISISHSGRTKNIVEFVKVAKARGITVISVTNYPKSVLAKNSDIVLLTAAFSYNTMGEVLAKRIPALCIIDVLCVAISMGMTQEQWAEAQESEKILLYNKV